MSHEPRYVVGLQPVTEEKRQFARRLRHEMTPHERKVWAEVRGRKLGGMKVRRQQVIDGYIADFNCAEAGVVPELDGEVHADQVEYDAHRDKVIASRRLIVLRFPNERIESELQAVLAEFLATCRARMG